jgi:ammonia channel protein AmtB
MNKYFLTLALMILLVASTGAFVIAQNQNEALAKINEASTALMNYESGKDSIWPCSKRFNHEARLNLQYAWNYFNKGDYKNSIFYAQASITATETAKLYADTECKCLYSYNEKGCGEIDDGNGPCGGLVAVTAAKSGCNEWYCDRPGCTQCYEGYCCGPNGCYPDPGCYTTDCDQGGDNFQPGGTGGTPQGRQTTGK